MNQQQWHSETQHRTIREWIAENFDAPCHIYHCLCEFIWPIQKSQSGSDVSAHIHTSWYVLWACFSLWVECDLSGWQFCREEQKELQWRCGMVSCINGPHRMSALIYFNEDMKYNRCIKAPCLIRNEKMNASNALSKASSCMSMNFTGI